MAPLFNYLIGEGDEVRRHSEAECLCSPEIDRQFKLNWELNGKLARLFASQYLVYIGRRVSIIISDVVGIG